MVMNTQNRVFDTQNWVLNLQNGGRDDHGDVYEDDLAHACDDSNAHGVDAVDDGGDHDGDEIERYASPTHNP